MNRYDDVQRDLREQPRTFLVTGAAGFIGSHLVETLLSWGQRVVGLDNFATGRRANLDDVLARVSPEAGARFTFIEGDVVDAATCARAAAGAQVVLHQAALGSVPRSLKDPIATHRANVDGFLNMLVAARDSGVARFVYASSSSVYGDEPALPKVESRIGQPLSPYAATKRINEIYAGVFQQSYGLSCIGLRYFNVFGPRQDPEGPYAAVIPRWVASLLRNEPCTIFGDGETSRDFCFVGNAVQANLLAALAPTSATGAVYNVAAGDRTTLLQLHAWLCEGLAKARPQLASQKPRFAEFRPGDVRHSLADVSAAAQALGYVPRLRVQEGLAAALDWYVTHAS